MQRNESLDDVQLMLRDFEKYRRREKPVVGAVPKKPSAIDPARRKWIEEQIQKAVEENRQKAAEKEIA